MPKTIIASLAKEAINKLYGTDIDIKQLSIQPTRPEIEGDFTLVVFPITKISKKNPADTAEDIGKYITDNTDIFSKYEVIKGFLNFTLKTDFWADFINKNAKDTSYGNAKAPTGKKILIEFSSPNTN
ncbi:MAG: arginine--tRNA ligase, partial [Bacteroidales bacterium]|nr:arginine--tRNA ligase [Bacteroidales bacterium]